MKKKTKIWLITAFSLIGAGLLIFGGVMTVLGWDFAKLSTNKYETNKYEITEDFNAISIDTDTADINFVISEGEKCSVECYELKKVKHSVSVKDGVLSVEVVDTRKWYERIGINLRKTKITLCLPEKEYESLQIKGSTGNVKIPDKFKFREIDISLSTGDVDFSAASETVKIKTSTGDIRIKNAVAENLELSASTGGITVSDTSGGNINVKVSTGKVKVGNVECNNLTAFSDTGDISLDKVVAKEKFSLKVDTGDIKFSKADAGEILAETDTGNISGTLLTDKIFIARTDTGKVDVPETESGGKCKVTTDTGDIKITII